MSTVAAPPATSAAARTRAAALGLSHDAAAIALVAVWFVVLAIATWGSWGDPTMDTGYDLLAGSRTAGGELPYADFFYYYGPAAPLLVALAFLAGGTGVGTAIALGLLLSVLAVALTYRLARCFCAPLGAGLAAALAATAALSSANNSFVLPHTTSAPLATVLGLAALVALASFAANGRRRHAIAAGSALGIVAVTRIDFALALYAAVAIWLALRILDARADRGSAWRDARAVAVPAVLLPAVVYGAFLTQVSLGDLLFENLYPTDQLDAAGDVVLRNNAPFTLGSAFELAGRLLLYAAGAAGLVALATAARRGGRARTIALALAGLGALAFLVVLAARPDTVRYYLLFAYEWIPAGAWLAAAILAWRSRRAAVRDVRTGQALLIALALAAIATLTYANFAPFPNAEHPSAVAYAMPFAAVFLVWLHQRALARGSRTIAAFGAAWMALLVAGSAGLVVHDARQETATVRGPGGSLTARPADAGALQGALDAVRRESAPGDAVLFAPQLTSLYVLADRSDPLPQLSLLPGALATPADERAAIDRMRAVRIVVTDRTPLTLYDHGSFGTTFDTVLADWLRRDFVRIASYRGTGPDPRTLDVWRRTSS